MASDRQYLEFIMDQLSPLGDVSYRAMMGEYILYYRGKIVGGIYDDREFLADLLNEMYGELPAPKKKKPGR